MDSGGSDVRRCPGHKKRPADGHQMLRRRDSDHTLWWVRAPACGSLVAAEPAFGDTFGGMWTERYEDCSAGGQTQSPRLASRSGSGRDIERLQRHRACSRRRRVARSWSASGGGRRRSASASVGLRVVLGDDNVV